VTTGAMLEEILEKI